MNKHAHYFIFVVQCGFQHDFDVTASYPSSALNKCHSLWAHIFPLVPLQGLRQILSSALAALWSCFTSKHSSTKYSSTKTRLRNKPRSSSAPAALVLETAETTLLKLKRKKQNNKEKTTHTHKIPLKKKEKKVFLNHFWGTDCPRKS